MKYKISAFNILEYGQRKDTDGNPHQEDSLFPEYGQLNENDRLFIVCDGMGGHDSGEVASATVCDAMSKAILEKNAKAAFTDEILNYAVNCAFDALDAKDTGAARKMGTTMTLLQLHQNGATIAHIGDSRVYHIRPGKDADTTRILHVTKDHSLLNNLLDIGELTEEDIPHFSQKNVITRAMQPNLERRSHADIYHTTDILPGDYFYLCTDGMLENTTDDNVRFIFSEAIPDKEKKDTLIKVTNENKDNHSAIVVHILAVEDVSETSQHETHQPIMAIIDDDGNSESIGDGTPNSPERGKTEACNGPIKKGRTERESTDTTTNTANNPHGDDAIASRADQEFNLCTANPNSIGHYTHSHYSHTSYLISAIIAILLGILLFLLHSILGKHIEHNSHESPQLSQRIITGDHPAWQEV